MHSVLVSDFDGTITENEFYALVLARRPGVPNYFSHYLEGRLTHFEAMAAVFSHSPHDRESLEAMLAEMRPDPRFGEAVARLHRAGWELEVASAGSAWYIERVLRAAGVEAAVHASPGRIEPGRGLVLEPPCESAYYDPEKGIDKDALVRDALARCDRVAFAGDGPLDLKPALMVRPEFRFARRWLAAELRRRDEPFQRFRRWPEIADMLLQS